MISSTETDNVMPRVQEATVSIIIPCYNQGRFLAETIDSALGQTYHYIEVLVVDDGSMDDTAQVAARYGERIHYIHQENAGPSAARNNGILASRGEFLHFLDADDRLTPDMLALQMQTAEQTPSGSVFHTSWQVVGADGQTVIDYVQAIPFPEDVFHSLLATNGGPPCRYTIRRSALAKSGMFDPHMLRNEDWDLWMRLAASGSKFVAVPQAMAIYRHHPNTRSKHFKSMWQTGVATIKKNSNYHDHCPLCREAVREGIKHVREYCFMSILKHDLAAFRRNGERSKGILAMFNAVVNDPLLIPLIIRETQKALYKNTLLNRSRKYDQVI